MILVRLNWNTPLYKIDEIVTKFKKSNKEKVLEIDLRLTDTECLIYIVKKLN